MDPLLIFLVSGMLFALLLGGAVGFFAGKASVKKDIQETEKEQAAQPLLRTDSVADAFIPPPAALTDRANADYHPVVCIWRNRDTGMIATEIKGKLYQEAAPLSTEVKRKLHEISREWAAWMSLHSHEKPQAESKGQPVRPPPASLTDESAAAEGISTKHKPVIDADPSQKAGRGVNRAPSLRSGSIVEQIDEILQEKLAASPVENRAIRIIEDPQRGVSVYVGLKRYNSIDEVAEPDALQMIRSAVAEWEKISGEKRQG